MKVAIAQFNSGENIDANISIMEEYCRIASREGADIIFAPEYSLCVAADPRSIMRGREASICEAIGSIARTNGIWVHAGTVQMAMPDGRCANRSLVFDASGALVAQYDKIHLFEACLDDGESWREADIYAAGDELVAVRTPVGLLGLSACYDVRFSPVYHAFGTMRVDAVAVPAAFTATTGAAHWHVLLRARAIETQCFVIAAAQTGVHSDGRETYGHSLIVDPWGDVLLDMGRDPGVGFCEIDTSAITVTRRQIPSLENRREFKVLPAC